MAEVARNTAQGLPPLPPVLPEIVESEPELDIVTPTAAETVPDVIGEPEAVIEIPQPEAVTVPEVIATEPEAAVVTDTNATEALVDPAIFMTHETHLVGGMLTDPTK